MEKSYDLAVIGAGPAGYEAAIRAAQLHLCVALVENRELGGTCLNRGCIPTKAILHAAELYQEAKRFDEIGLHADGLFFDYGVLTRRKNEVVTQLRTGIEQLIKSNKIDLFRGTGQIADSGTVHVTPSEGELVELKAKQILIASGSIPSLPPIPGSDLPDVVTSDGLLGSSAKFYPRLVIIGGGVIGVEFAAAMNALGSDVTVIEAMGRILPTMDRELSQSLAMLLKKRGVKIHTSASVERIESAVPLSCVFTEMGETHSVEADGILIATGRRPNTAGLFAEGCAVEMERGAIRTDEHFETSLKGVFAVGDARKGIQLAHAASAQGIAAVEHIAGETPTVHLEAIPACVYTSPEIASVGLTADEAKEQGIEVKTGKSLTGPNGRSLIAGQERGFAKLVFLAEDGALIGAQLLCARATDLISELTEAVVHRLTAQELASLVRPHPTFSELITEAAEDALGGAIHAMPKRSFPQ